MPDTPDAARRRKCSYCHFPQLVIECKLPITGNRLVKRPRSGLSGARPFLAGLEVALNVFVALNEYGESHLGGWWVGLIIGLVVVVVVVVVVSVLPGACIPDQCAGARGRS